MTFEAYAQGQNHLAQVYFQAASFTGPFYIGLGTGGIPEGRLRTLSNVTEVTGPGYARRAVNRDGTGAGWVVTDGVAASPLLTFTNTDLGDVSWNEATYAFLTLSPSGTTAPAIILGSIELPVPFTLEAGETESFVYKFAFTAPA